MQGGTDSARTVAGAGRRRVAMRVLPVGFVALALAGVAGCGLITSPSEAAAPEAGVSSSPAPPAAPTTLALVTDIGNCDEGQAEVAAMVHTWGAEAITTAGDNTQGVENCVPYTDSVDDYYSDYSKDPAGPRFWPVLGNHDHQNTGAGVSVYRDYFSYLPTDADPQGRWYDKQLGAVHFFMLDSEASDADLAAQRSWLESELTAARASEPATWNVVVFHRPAHSSGHHGEFAPMSESAGWDYQGWGADIVVAGHQHIYEDVLVDGLHHVTAGVGASDIARPCPDTRVAGSRLCLEGPGAMRLTATPSAMILEYLQPEGGAGILRDVITLER